MPTYAPNDTAGNVNTRCDLISKKSPNRYHLSRLFRKRGMRELAELLLTVNGTVVGSSASTTYARVEATRDLNANVLGGVRTIETVEQVGANLDSSDNDANAGTARNTATADTTAITSMLPGGTEASRAPGTYPTDASGNGGGGKLSGVSY